MFLNAGNMAAFDMNDPLAVVSPGNLLKIHHSHLILVVMLSHSPDNNFVSVGKMFMLLLARPKTCLLSTVMIIIIIV